MGKRRSNLEGINVLLGVSGGIAAYKAVDLASKLTSAGTAVKTAMTENATKLVEPKSFEAVTGSMVYTSLWETPVYHSIGHISLSDWADVVVVAPATADIIAKVANGICDDLLSTTLCTCWSKPVLFAPAMNNNMWTNPAVQRNVKRLRQAGIELVGPKVGRLACGTEAIGRMAEPTEIIEAIKGLASKLKPRRK